MITNEELLKIAELARLEINDDQVATFAGQVSAILSYIDILKELPVEGIAPTAHASQVNNVFRAEDLSSQKVVESVLAQAPQAEDGFFKVPKVL